MPSRPNSSWPSPGRNSPTLQRIEPGHIRRVQAGEPDCELEVRYAAVDSETLISVEHEIGIRSITAVSHLSGGSEAAGGIVFADEIEGDGIVRVASYGIDQVHVDLVALRRIEIQDGIDVRPVNFARRENTAAIIGFRPTEHVCTGSAGQGVAVFAAPE